MLADSLMDVESDLEAERLSEARVEVDRDSALPALTDTLVVDSWDDDGLCTPIAPLEVEEVVPLAEWTVEVVSLEVEAVLDEVGEAVLEVGALTLVEDAASVEDFDSAMVDVSGSGDREGARSVLSAVEDVRSAAPSRPLELNDAEETKVSAVTVTVTGLTSEENDRDGEAVEAVDSGLSESSVIVTVTGSGGGGGSDGEGSGPGDGEGDGETEGATSAEDVVVWTAIASEAELVVVGSGVGGEDSEAVGGGGVSVVDGTGSAFAPPFASRG